MRAPLLQALLCASVAAFTPPTCLPRASDLGVFVPGFTRASAQATPYYNHNRCLTEFLSRSGCARLIDSDTFPLRAGRAAGCVQMALDAGLGDVSGRRSAIVDVGRAGLASLALLTSHAERAAAKDSELLKRLQTEKVQQLAADMGNQKDIEYPAWLEGTWQVTSTLYAFRAPLGSRFLGGSSPEINERSAAEAAVQTGKPIRYLLRFERLPSGKVREDRLFNQQQRLDAFAGRSVVKRIQYVAIDRGEKTKELNTLVYFAGGLAGKTFSTRRRYEAVGPQVRFSFFFCFSVAVFPVCHSVRIPLNDVCVCVCV